RGQRETHHGRCPLCIISGHTNTSPTMSAYSHKRKYVRTIGMSVTEADSLSSPQRRTPGHCPGAPFLDSRYPVSASAGFDVDLLRGLLGFGFFGQCQREHAILEGCVDLVWVNALRHLEATFERTKVTFLQVIAPLLFFFFFLLFALYGQDAIRHFDLDVLLVQARQFGRNFVRLLTLDDVYRRHRPLH